MDAQLPEDVQKKIDLGRTAARENQSFDTIRVLRDRLLQLSSEHDTLLAQRAELQAENAILQQALIEQDLANLGVERPDTETPDIAAHTVACRSDKGFKIHPIWSFPEGNDLGRKAPILPLMSPVQESTPSLWIGDSPKEDGSYHVFLAGDPDKRYSWQVFVTFNGYLIRFIGCIKNEDEARRLYVKASAAVKAGKFHAPEETDDAT